MGISFICAQFSMTHLLGCFERSSFSVLEKEDIIPCPILNKEKIKIVFCYFYALVKTPQGPNKFEQNGPRHAGFRRHLDGYPCLRE